MVLRHTLLEEQEPEEECRVNTANGFLLLLLLCQTPACLPEVCSAKPKQGEDLLNCIFRLTYSSIQVFFM